MSENRRELEAQTEFERLEAERREEARRELEAETEAERWETEYTSMRVRAEAERAAFSKLRHAVENNDERV